MLRYRVLSAAVLVPLVAVFAWLGGAWFASLVILAALLAVWEYGEMLRHAGHQPLTLLLYGVAFLLPLDAYLGPTSSLGRLALAGAVTLPLLWQMMGQEPKGAIVNWSLSLAGALYVGWLIAHFVLLRQFPQGLEWVAVALVGTWACDTGAYVCGKAFGRHKFFPEVSPHKTWEGTIGGIALGLLVSPAAVPLLGLPLALALVLGALVATSAIAGDLVESFLKRQTGVKDSGALIPGHGGMLDRIDSLLFVCTATYYFAILVGR